MFALKGLPSKNLLALFPQHSCLRYKLLSTQAAASVYLYDDVHTFNKESNVMSYGRSFPKVICKASGSLMYDVNDNKFIDFFAGAGSLNYGHNHPLLKEKLIEYIKADGISQGLDMFTAAKKDFVNAFYELILEPRGMGDYKIQFTGPTGCNAVEAALKLTVRTICPRLR